MLLAAGPTFCVDGAWGVYVRDTLVVDPLFWTPHGLALFDGELATRSPEVLIGAIKTTLGAAGGTEFFISYLQEVADMAGETIKNRI